MLDSVLFEMSNVSGNLEIKTQIDMFADSRLSKFTIENVAIQHSENKTITSFENEVGPGVLQFSV